MLLVNLLATYKVPSLKTICLGSFKPEAYKVTVLDATLSSPEPVPPPPPHAVSKPHRHRLKIKESRRRMIETVSVNGCLP